MSVDRDQSHTPPLAPPIRVSLTTLPEQPCPYLPGRRARSRAVYADWLPAELHHDFMDAGFRRSGKVIYQPVCRGCRACVPIRLEVERFAPGKSQRRCWRRNQDLAVEVAEPKPTDEKYALYQRYLAGWHDGAMSDDRESFEAFLYDSPVETVEFAYRTADGTLAAVGLCDRCSRSLSSVYFYFDPALARRALGTFGVLVEIDFARRMNIPYYYLGYWVAGCRAMEYKSNFRPYQLLHADGVWRDGNEVA